MLYQKFIILIIIVLWYFGLGILAFWLYQNYGLYDFFKQSLILSTSAGILAGIIFITRSFYKATEESEFGFAPFDKHFRAEVWWYPFRPILSGVFGLLSFLALYVAFDLENSFQNQIAFFVISYFIGYDFWSFVERFVRDIYDKMRPNK